MKKTVFAALFALSSPAFAQGFVGLGFGQTSTDLQAEPTPAGISATVNDTDTSFKLFGGAAINENIGVEVGYIDFGEVSVEYTDGSLTASDNYAVTALYFALVGSVPVGQASLLVKLGFASWDLDYTLRSNFGAYGSANDSGTDPMFGVGVQFNATEQLALRAELERFDVDGEDVDVIGVAAAVKF